MRVLTLTLCVLLISCAHEEPLPPVAPPPEDLSQWTIPELVQPPPEKPRLSPSRAPVGPSEKVFDYTPGHTYDVPVALQSPLDVILERGEVVRNIVGGDREKQDPGHEKAPRWQIVEGVDGEGETQRSHVFITVTDAGLS